MTKESVSWMSLEHSLAQALSGFLSRVPTPLLASSALLASLCLSTPRTSRLMGDGPSTPPGDSFLLLLMDPRTHSGAISDMRVFNPSSQA